MGITSKKMFRNILDIHPCVECDCMCSWSVISSTNNPCEGIPWLSVSVQKLVNLVKLGGKLPRLWCPLCVLLTPLGHQRLEFPPLLCLHMNSHHALSTHVTGESSAHHTKPLSTPTPPLSSPELSRVPRNRVTAPAISVKHSAALLHHPPCNLQGKSTTHTDLESQHEQTLGFLWKINKSNGLSNWTERSRD